MKWIKSTALAKGVGSAMDPKQRQLNELNKSYVYNKNGRWQFTPDSTGYEYNPNALFKYKTPADLKNYVDPYYINPVIPNGTVTRNAWNYPVVKFK